MHELLRRFRLADAWRLAIVVVGAACAPALTPHGSAPSEPAIASAPAVAPPRPTASDDRRQPAAAATPTPSATPAPPAPRLVATIVTHRIHATDTTRLLPTLRAAMPAIARCYDRTTWIDVRLRVDAGGAVSGVEVVDPEVTGLCVRDLVGALSFPSAHGAKPSAVEVGMRIGPPLDDAALPAVGADEDLVRNGDGSCGATRHISCPPNTMCPRADVHAARCPTERPTR